MGAVTHPKIPARKRGVDEEGVISNVSTERTMDMSEDVKHGLYPLHSGQ